MYSGPDDFWIEQVEGKEVEGADATGDDQVAAEFCVDRESGKYGRGEGKGQADVGNQAQESAQGPNQEWVGELDKHEENCTQDGEDDSKHEVAGHVGARHFGHAFHALSGDGAVWPVKHVEEGALDVVAPTEHEVNEKGYETGHQGDTIDGFKARVEEAQDRGFVLLDSDFLHWGRGIWVYRRGGYDACATAFLLCFELLGLLLLNLFGHHLGHAAFEVCEAVCGTVDQFAYLFAVAGEVVDEAAGLGYEAEPREVDEEDKHGADEEAGDGAWDPPAHEAKDKGLEDEGDDDGADEGYEEGAPVVEHADDAGYGDDARGAVGPAAVRRRAHCFIRIAG